ncbi:hypothetical protein C7M84_008020 [Penaeus vannamei]|uniref:Uncharacterized protein n=1 Tax=Penaeus vannamei TaxID=6689 RepID=A0A3R7SSV1_PENVA|nr:hypothetical protein C7M84_008020 [Penaeus vannamei]
MGENVESPPGDLKDDVFSVICVKCSAARSRPAPQLGRGSLFRIPTESAALRSALGDVSNRGNVFQSGEESQGDGVAEADVSSSRQPPSVAPRDSLVPRGGCVGCESLPPRLLQRRPETAREAGMPLQDASSCHHCHIHAPIPSEDLKRTHPLRSSQIGKPQDSISSRGHDFARDFKKNVSFLYGKIQRRDARGAPKETQSNGRIPPPPPLPPHIRTVDLPPVVVVETPVSRAALSKVQTPVLNALTLAPARCAPVTSAALAPSPAPSLPPPLPPPLRDARSRHKRGAGWRGCRRRSSSAPTPSC